ncbi:DNA excision repair protein ERCC-6 isoform X2 [Rhipicephalus microplus]|uniref:DNA excision repair protein ERCC-6 isoform X2 n=1 Tax=Rhipicephalus microplus TaxID=6941 RepID=UPI0018886FC5|nr:DNA excision repair protein ERCC-6-like isoform X1 [Rhipicephalus microplus]
MDSGTVGAEVLDAGEHGSAVVGPSESDGTDMEQTAELQDLGISVFSGADLERGVLEEMDRIVQQKEAEERRKAAEKKLLTVRKDITAVKKKIERLEKSVSVHHLAASHHISSVLFTTHRDRDAKMEELQELEAEEKRLLAIDFEGGSSDIPKPKETEEEMLIRTGEMTPFGSTVAPSSSLCAAQPSTSAQLVSQVPPPRKRKKKERLGTVTRRRSTMPQKSRLEEEFVVDLDESDSEVSGQSDEDYLPESLGSDEDYAGDIAIVKERKGRQAKKATSGQLEGPPTKRLKKLTDDGNYAAYLKRLKEQRRLKLLEKHRRIMEDEDSDSESAVDVDEEFCVPKNIWNRLYRYQQTGVRWLWELHRQGCGGIVGDEMGLGKTIQTIAFLAGLRHSRLRTLGDSFTGLGPVLLVCPTTVMHQWVREFHCWCPPLRVAILHDSGSFSGNKVFLGIHLARDYLQRTCAQHGPGPALQWTADVKNNTCDTAELRFIVPAWLSTTVTSHHVLYSRAIKAPPVPSFASGHGCSTTGNMLSNPFCFVVQVFLGIYLAPDYLQRTCAQHGPGPALQWTADVKNNTCDTAELHFIVPAWLSTTVKSHHVPYSRSIKAPPVASFASGHGCSTTGNMESLVKQMTKENGVLVTSYACVSKMSGLLLKHEWHYVILDEGHKIRNPDAQTTLACKQFRTPHRLILSGSPIQNNLRELWSLLDFVFPGKLGTLPVFMQEFAVPITQGGYSNASDVQVRTAYRCATALRDSIKPYLLRRMKEDVRTNLQLPNKNEQVLFCRLTDHQRELYQQYLDSADVASILVGRLQVFVGLMNLRKICNHPDLYDGGPKVFADTDVSTLPPEMRYGFPGRSAKMAVIESLLRLWKKQNHRVLLFTQSRQMLVILERFVQDQGYNYMVMTGATPIASRQPFINKFNGDPSVFVFLLTTRVGGLGVNLTGADRVVIYDPDWNPSTDTQARERAWRIGQRRDVTIYRLLTAGTIEEKIYHRQIFKQFLTNRVLKDPKQRRFFKTNDLYELFTLPDDNKKQRTETSAIFAGTGSDVQLKKSKKSGEDSPVKGSSQAGNESTKIADPGAAEAKGSTEQGLLSKEKIRQMRELARQLSQRIGAGTKKPEKKPHHKQHKSKKSVVEGENISGVVKQAVFKPEVTAEQSQKQDDYVLHKLFKKSGVHSAMQHDAIVDSAAPDYALVEGEAERVAQQAIRRLRESRRRCLAAGSGVPTWTGLHGSSGAPPRPRFGPRMAQSSPLKRPATKPGLLLGEPNVFTQEEASSAPASSSELLACIRARKPAEECEAFLDTGESNFDELLSDLQTFVAFGASVDGQASTQEVLAAFKHKVQGGTSASVFKALLSKICEFHRQEDGQGVWKLRPEFR